MTKYLTLCFITLLQTVQAQNFELESRYFFGPSTKSFASNNVGKFSKFETNYVYIQGFKTLHDRGYGFKLKYRPIKKHNLWLSFGQDFATTSYNFVFTDGTESYVHGKVFETFRRDFNLGIYQKIKLYTEKLHLEFGLCLTTRDYIGNYRYFYDEGIVDPRGYKELSYNFVIKQNVLHQYSGDYVKWYHYRTAAYRVQLDFQLNKFLNFNFGMEYSRNHSVSYNYEYRVDFYYNGSVTPNGVYYNLGSNRDFTKVDDFIYLTAGLSYKFGSNDKWNIFKKKDRK